MNKTQELRERLLSASPAEIENIVDAELRHKSPKRDGYDYLKEWLKVGRCFGYATKDDSWGEFEKIFPIIIRRMIIAERELGNHE